MSPNTAEAPAWHQDRGGLQRPALGHPLSPWVISFPSVPSIPGPLTWLKNHKTKGSRPSWGPPGTHSLLQVQLAILPPSPPSLITHLPPTPLPLSPLSAEECSILTCCLLPATTCPLAPSSNLPLPAGWAPGSLGCWPIFQKLHGSHLSKPREKPPEP